jgi:hypothetical protein
VQHNRGHPESRQKSTKSVIWEKNEMPELCRL